jgi:hypothetical protein
MTKNLVSVHATNSVLLENEKKRKLQKVENGGSIGKTRKNGKRCNWKCERYFRE